MRKSDLKNGMRVILRNGERYIIVGDLMYDDNWRFARLSFYDDELKEEDDFLRGHGEWDIVEVHKAINKANPLDIMDFTRVTLLWERKGLSEQDKKVIEAIRLLKPNYKWIARDEDKKLYVHRTEPLKGQIGWYSSSCTNFDEEHLQFIQWEDKEPYYIGE